MRHLINQNPKYVRGKLQWGQHILKHQQAKVPVRNKTLRNEWKMNNEHKINRNTYVMPRKLEIVENFLVKEKCMQERNHKRVKKVLLPTMVKAMCLLLKYCITCFFSSIFFYLLCKNADCSLFIIYL